VIDAAHSDSNLTTKPEQFVKVFSLFAPAAQQLHGVLTDIDDTLTHNGSIEPVALDALHRLHKAGVPVLAITGRSAGWSEPFARDWPVLGIVAENGSVCLRNQEGTLTKTYTQAAPQRAEQHVRLQAVLHDIETLVPGARRARDSAGRETDIAIDHSEFHRLDADRIQQVLALMHSAGLSATVSSIHINGWFGAHNKYTGACWALQALLGVNLPTVLEHWVFVGDSPNDQVMFQHLPLSVGVANIRHFDGQLTHAPRWVTANERGAGFAEVANVVLAARVGDRS
jgi:HAD superfamily hydrolase (TIGR01484 family)